MQKLLPAPPAQTHGDGKLSISFLGSLSQHSPHILVLFLIIPNETPCMFAFLELTLGISICHPRRSKIIFTILFLTLTNNVLII